MNTSLAERTKRLVMYIADAFRDRVGHIVAPHQARGFRSSIWREKERMTADLNCDSYHFPFITAHPTEW